MHDIAKNQGERQMKVEGRDVPVGQHLQGRYMTFKLSEEEYGLEILKVKEIIRLMHITRVPGTDGFIRGVINLRGKVITVVDLRLLLGMAEGPATDQTAIIVVQYEIEGIELTMGILVDEVEEVRSISAEQIEPPPGLGVGISSLDFILGVGKVDKRVIFLVDIGRILSSKEAATLHRITADA